MKRIFLLLLFISSLGFSQSSGITYQAVIYNPNGEELPGIDNPYAPLTNQDVCLQFGIVDADGNVEYQEQVQVTTDAFGMVNLLIGTNTQTGGYAADFAGVEWSADAKFLKVDLDIKGNCTDFEELSYQPFTYVPFAYYSPASDVPGPEGPEGPAGADGQDGAEGPQGPTGADGATGLAGPAGANGATGPQGQDGVDGLDGVTGQDGEAGYNTLINTSNEGPGDNCENGGIKIELGLDVNRNNILEIDEVNNSLTVYVCNGGTGDGDGNGDNNAPTITLIGENPQIINVDVNYVELGATAYDEDDGDITSSIVIDSSLVNTSLAGSYNVTYTVTDSSGNTVMVIRQVNVITSGSLIGCDGGVVPTVVYGTQEWTVEDACHITYRDGTPIPQVTDDLEWANLTTGAWSYYDNDSTKPRLYNWYAVMGINDAASLTDATLRKEFAPEGWHVPSNNEWFILEEHLVANGYNFDGTNSWPNACSTNNSLSQNCNKIAKAMASSLVWTETTDFGNPGWSQVSNNSSGFSALPSGWRQASNFNGEGFRATFWSTTERPTQPGYAYYRYIRSDYVFLQRDISLYRNGSSVRLVKD